ncbi:MAG TPA: T9SS type A sorting domain-containing protein, partial [Candidatus Kapabacteria bacterium]|nr:T9SS type A sorting domain-containing protein [Candidatus Kapabacteria bacterium]
IYLNECEIYNPVNNTWRVIDSMTQTRTIGCLTTFSDGTTLASGGRNSPISCAPGSEILNPSTMTWSNTDPMKQPVHWPATVLLPLDNFISTGGLTDADFESSNDVTGTATCEWYDRFDRRWYYAPKMNQARCKHAAVYLHQECNLSLPFDLVLVAGGLTGNNTYTNTCEILDIGSSALASYKTTLNPQSTLSVSQKLDMTMNVSLAILGNTSASPIALFSLDKNENAKIDIVNSVGQVVNEVTNTSFTQGIHSLALNTSGLPAGVYFVRLEALSGNALSKLLVVR